MFLNEDGEFLFVSQGFLLRVGAPFLPALAPGVFPFWRFRLRPKSVAPAPKHGLKHK